MFIYLRLKKLLPLPYTIFLLIFIRMSNIIRQEQKTQQISNTILNDLILRWPLNKTQSLWHVYTRIFFLWRYMKPSEKEKSYEMSSNFYWHWILIVFAFFHAHFDPKWIHYILLECRTLVIAFSFINELFR